MCTYNNMLSFLSALWTYQQLQDLFTRYALVNLHLYLLVFVAYLINLKRDVTKSLMLNSGY